MEWENCSVWRRQPGCLLLGEVEAQQGESRSPIGTSAELG